MKKITSFILVLLAVIIFVSACGGETEPARKMFVDGIPTVVKIGRDDCVACIEMNKILAEVDDEIGDTVNIVKISTEEEPEAIKEFGIGAIPTIIFFDTSKSEKYRFVGKVEKDEVIALVEECR